MFEIPKIGGGYASVPTTLVSFTSSSDGAGPDTGLVFDASGNLFGRTAGGGANLSGTVFELSGAGTPLSQNSQTADFNADRKSDILLRNTNGQAAIWLMNGATPLTAMTLVGANPGSSWHAVGTGDFYGNGYSDILWQNISTGEVYIWEIDGTKVIGGGSPGNPGTSWHAIGE